MRLPNPRKSQTLKIKGRPIPFSVYPVKRTTRRFGLQSRIFSTTPWGVIRQVVEDRLKHAAQDQALAFLRQAQNFYEIAGSSYLSPTKPLLFYYSFLNLAKSLSLTKNIQSTYDRAVHGLSESKLPNGNEFHDSIVTVKGYGSLPRIYNDLKKSLTGRTDPNGREYKLKNVMPQLIPGHRIWCSAANEKERFVEVKDVKFKFDSTRKLIWSEFEIFSDDLTRFSISRKRLLIESGLSKLFREVAHEIDDKPREILRFEQCKSVRYTGRPSDKIADIVSGLKPYLWFNVTVVPPYRKTYLYMCPSQHKAEMLPQLLSMYIAFFYLGSVTRYRPNLFQEIMDSSHGSHLEEIIISVPQQFLYLIASEFAEREVVQAPLV